MTHIVRQMLLLFGILVIGLCCLIITLVFGEYGIFIAFLFALLFIGCLSESTPRDTEDEEWNGE